MKENDFEKHDADLSDEELEFDDPDEKSGEPPAEDFTQEAARDPELREQIE